MYLMELIKKLSDNKVPKKHRSPFVFSLLQKCQNYGIPYQLMCEINYNDLLALIVEYDISALKDHFKSKQKELEGNRGVNVIDANENQVANMHKRK